MAIRSSKVCVVGVPFGEGQDWERGVEGAPAALRAGGLERVVRGLGFDFLDFGDVAVPPGGSPAVGSEGIKNFAKVQTYLGSVFGLQCAAVRSVPLAVEVAVACADESCPRADAVNCAPARPPFLLTLGGDHSLGCASICAQLARFPDLGVVWVDAHGDCNRATSSVSHNYHGMPAAHAMGWFPGFAWMPAEVLAEERMVFVALRDLDEAEKRDLRNSKCLVFTMDDVETLGIAGVMTKAIAHLRARPVHLSFDIDAIDPSVAPGTGTKARGGLSYREAHHICKRLAAETSLVGMDLVEINPTLDERNEHNLHGDDPLISTELATVRLGLELVASALGRSLI